MNAAPIAPEHPAEKPPTDDPNWSAGRWFFYLALAFGLHIGLIFGLGDRKPIQPRPVKNAAALQTLTHPRDGLELHDPRIFALPHPRGFAGMTWLQRPEIAFAPFRWTEPPRLLALAVEQLGATFARYAETNAPVLRTFEITAAPLTAVLPPGENASPRGPGRLRGTGNLAHRPPRNAPASLPPQAAPDGLILTNTVVQVLVEAQGQVISAVLIPPGSGAKTTDQRALQLARTLRFQAVDPATPTTVGRLIFEWQTLPATNGPASPP
jgi:hypothetical protein